MAREVLSPIIFDPPSFLKFSLPRKTLRLLQPSQKGCCHTPNTLLKAIFLKRDNNNNNNGRKETQLN